MASQRALSGGVRALGRSSTTLQKILCTTSESISETTASFTPSSQVQVHVRKTWLESVAFVPATATRAHRALLGDGPVYTEGHENRRLRPCPHCSRRHEPRAHVGVGIGLRNDQDELQVGEHLVALKQPGKDDT